MKHKTLRLLSILAAFVLLFSTTVPVYAAAPPTLMRTQMR